MAINPKDQRKGLGKFLLTNLIERSSYMHKNLNIHLEVRDTNETAKAFYKSMGFKTIGNRPNFYKDGSDALLLTKETNNK